MEVLDVLILSAELSMALAGFAGIIATFQFRGNTNIRRADAVGLSMIVIYSLLAALQSGLILILNVMGLSDAMLWATGSMLSAFFNAYNLYSFYRNMRGAVRNQPLLRVMWILQFVSILILLINLLNAMDVVFHRTPGPFLIGLAWGLGLAGWMFARLLLIPVWRTVRTQEALAGDAGTLDRAPVPSESR